MKKFYLFGCSVLLTSLLNVGGNKLYAQGFSWVKAGFSNSSGTKGQSITHDAGNNIIVAGSFSGNPQIGSVNLTSNGYSDAFVCKTDPSGNVLWVKTFGGSMNEFGMATAVDNSGNVYVTGSFMSNSITFDANNTLTSSYPGTQTVFLVKYSASGVFQWAKKGSGNSGNFADGQALTADASGNIIAGGSFQQHISFSGTALTGGATSLYLVKYDSNGNVVWAKTGNTTSFCKLNGLTTDAAGNIYATGKNNNPVQWGTSNFPNHGGDDAFTAKFNAAGEVQWLKFLGNTAVAGTTANNWDSGNGIAVDNNGNVYTCGSLLADSLNVGINTGQVPFVVKYNSSGSQEWLKKYTAGDINVLNGIATDNSGKVFITGVYEGNLSLDNFAFPASASNSKDAFIACLAANGTLQWGTRGSSVASDIGYGIATDNNNNIICTGECSNVAQFDTITLVTGATQLYVAKMGGSATSSIKGAEKIAAYTIYPNPATHMIQVVTTMDKAYDVSIFNNAGQLVKTAYANRKQCSLDISQLAPGAYYIAMKTVTGDYSVARFIKE